MDSLPIDVSHPAVRDYLALVRLQVLTPLSLLINIAVTSACATLLNPNLVEVERRHPTTISPHPSLTGTYVLAIYTLQIGYCTLLVLARKPETKRALTKAVGFSLVFANWVMPLWAIAAVFEWFILATILQGLLLLFLLYSNIALLIYHAPTTERPLDMLLLHAPLRFFLALPLNILFPYCLFVALGFSFSPTIPGGPTYSSPHTWFGFAVVFTTNIIALFVIVIRQDVVWCIAAIWLCASEWVERPKPTPVFATVVTFTVVHPLALLASFAYQYLRAPTRRSAISLPPGEDPLHRGAARRSRAPSISRESGTAPELDPDQVWT